MSCKEKQVKAGDEITINATIVELTASGNPIIKIPSGGKFLIKASDVNTIHPHKSNPKEDMRRGK